MRPLYPEPNREGFCRYVRVTVQGEGITTQIIRVEGQLLVSPQVQCYNSGVMGE